MKLGCHSLIELLLHARISALACFHLEIMSGEGAKNVVAKKKKECGGEGAGHRRMLFMMRIISQGSSWLIVLDFHRLDYFLKREWNLQWPCNLGETFQAGLCQGFKNLKMDESRPKFSTPNAVKLFKADDLWRSAETVWTEFNPEGLEDGKAKRHWFWKVTALWVKGSFWFPKAEGVSCILYKKQCGQ